jgi:hypothetical protein
MASLNNLRKLITRSDVASYFGMDRRREIFKHLRPVAYVTLAGKTVELFDGTLLSSLSVNAASHPIEQGTPEL